MPKQKKKKPMAHRFDPLSRPENGMEVDRAPVKKLSAHQLRHLERKRLQAESTALKNSRRKVSKTNKLDHKKQKKALSAGIKVIKQQTAELKGNPLATNRKAGPSEEFAFALPMPGQRRDKNTSASAQMFD